MQGKTKTAVIYARYSSDKQREASIDDQLRVCMDFCEREGIEVVGQYTDYAKSGKTDQRPQFRRMIDNAPESDYVLVYMFDRFSRSRYDSAMYKRALRECGVRVISASEKVDDSPEGDLHEGMLEILSEYYVADLARKVRRGMEGNALKAKDNGYKLFGYDTDPVTRRYVVNEAEAEVVREIFARHIGGDSIYAIAQDLASRGLTTSKGTPVNYNWVSRILKRKAYTGVYSWNGIEVEGGMPVIIDEGTFEQNKHVPRRKPREDEERAVYWLSGKLFCGLCGEPMHGYGGTSHTGKRYYYYGCKENGDCKMRGVRREVVENAVAEAVLDISADEERMRLVARRIVEAYEKGDTRAQIDSVNDQIEALEKEQHNITTAARKGLVTDEMVERNNEIKKQLRKLHSRHGILMSEAMELNEDEIVDLFAHGFNRNDEEFIFHRFVNQAFLYKEFIVLVFNFRDEHGDLEETVVSIEQYLRKNPNLTSRFGYFDSGVGGGT